MEKVKYNIPNINCNHCAHTIKMELGDMDGINEIEVDVNQKQVTVAYESPATPEEIEKLLAEINYPVEK